MGNTLLKAGNLCQQTARERAADRGASRLDVKCVRTMLVELSLKKYSALKLEKCSKALIWQQEPLV